MDRKKKAIEPGRGTGENGEPIQVVEFNYEAIDGESVTQSDLDGASLALKTILSWVWQSGMNNEDGLQIRALIVCWIFLPYVRPMTMTELARMFGKDKQSLGRWHSNFKRRFPYIRTSHMQP